MLNAVVGFAGLPATLAALGAGIDLALANKESLVAGGELALAAWERGAGRVLPVDSEHRALFQCLEGRDAETGRLARAHRLRRAVPWPYRDELTSVTPEEALAHPTWNMGPKITIDSATLMNKGLELIEAHFLFAVPYDRIEVAIHPSSVVHSLVRFRDGAALAHLGLSGHARADLVRADVSRSEPRRRCRRLDLASGLMLEFHAPDEEAFPCLALARAAGEAGGTRAVRAQRRERGRGCRIPRRRAPVSRASPRSSSVRSASAETPAARDLDELVAVDAEARAVARDLAAQLVP